MSLLLPFPLYVHDKHCMQASVLALLMEITVNDNAKPGFMVKLWTCIMALLVRLKEEIVTVLKKVKKIGEDDPRRITHSLKVGLALTLVSLIYYLRPLYDGFGVSGMWAVMTVVVVFEFTVGAILSKGLNRTFATLLAGLLGVGVHYLAELSGEKGEPILLGASVFIFAAGSTFSRFFPKIKARYDYGVMIFILTFSLVSVSSYRMDDIIQLAHQRLSTVAIGGGVCLLISLFVCPVWAGEDLHKLISQNIQKLAIFLEDFEGEYLKKEENGGSISKELLGRLQGYKSLLYSKVTEESLANFARWEPGHGRFKFKHPWKIYLQIGGLTRQCAYCIESLLSCANTDIQTPAEFRSKICTACSKLCLESSKALKELSCAIQSMKEPISADCHITSAATTVHELQTALQTAFTENTPLLEIIPTATMACLLIEIVSLTEKIAEKVNELASLAHFETTQMVSEKPPSIPRAAVRPLSDMLEEEKKYSHVIVIKSETQINEDSRQSNRN